MKSIFKKHKILNLLIFCMITISCLLTCFSSYVLSLALSNMTNDSIQIAIYLVIGYFFMQVTASLLLAAECYLEEVMKNRYRVYIRNLISETFGYYALSDMIGKEDFFLNLQINNVDHYFTEYIDNIYNITYNIVITIGGLVVMFLLFPFMALGVIVGIGVSYAMSRLYDRFANKEVYNLMNVSKIYNSSIFDIFNGIKSIKINRFGSFFIKKNAIHTRKYEDTRKNYKNKMKLISSLTYLPTFLVDLIILFLIVYYIYLGKIGFNVLAVYVLIQGLVMNNAESLFYNLTSAYAGRKALSIKDFNCQKSVIQNNTNLIQLDKISLHEVSYAYDDNLVLKDLNLDFIQGKKYLIVGENGSGKSTIIKLITKQLPNFNYESIEFGDINSSSLLDSDIYENVSYVPQRPYIFSASLYYNIFFDKEVSQGFANKIVDACCLNQLVSKNADGLNHIIENNGVNISGGEKQRITIARALARESKVLILDEPFKNIDHENAKKILDYIFNLEQTLVIIISHDMNTDIENLCDKVYRIKKVNDWSE